MTVKSHKLDQFKTGHKMQDPDSEDMPLTIKTVAELRKALEAFPDDMELITSADKEGNGYNGVFLGVTVAYIKGRYADGDRWDGDMVLTEGDHELKDMSEEDLDCQYKKVLLIS